MGTTTSHIKLGVFILAGTALAVSAVIFLGLSQVFRETVPAETYFNESVQGLSVGAPVKYRGVEIGRVSGIGFVVTKYPESRDAEGIGDRYVLVEIRISKEALLQFAIDDLKKDIRRLVSSGLRVRTTTQGLTGVAFLEMNFFDPEQNPPLAIDWSPQSLYIPSAPSTMSRVEAALNGIGRGLKQFEKMDFQKMFGTLDAILVKADAILTEVNVQEISSLLAENLRNLNKAISRVEDLLASPEAESIIPDAAATVRAARSMAESTGKSLETVMADAQDAVAGLKALSLRLEKLAADPAVQQSLQELPETMKHVNQATLDIRRGAVQFDRLLRSLNDLVVARRDDIEAMLESTRTLMDNLNAVTREVKENPSAIIFSGPPRSINPEELQ